MWSTATLRATRMIHAENGTSRGSYFSSLRHQLREDVLRDVLGLEVVAHDARDVAVDVIGVADVQEAERLAVALLGAHDRLVDRAVGRLVVGEAARAPETAREHAGLIACSVREICVR